MEAAICLCFYIISIGILEEWGSWRTWPESGISTCPNDSTSALMSSKERGCLQSHHRDFVYWFWSAGHTKQELEPTVGCLPTLLCGASCGLWDLNCTWFVKCMTLFVYCSVCVKFLSSACEKFQGQDIYFNSSWIVCDQAIGDKIPFARGYFKVLCTFLGTPQLRDLSALRSFTE